MEGRSWFRVGGVLIGIATSLAFQACGGDDAASTVVTRSDAGTEAAPVARYEADPPPTWTPAKQLAERSGIVGADEGSDVRILDYWIVAAPSRKLPPVAVDVQREDTVGLVVTTSEALGLRHRISVTTNLGTEPSKPEMDQIAGEPASRMRWEVDTPAGPVNQEAVSVLRDRSGFRITYSAPADYFRSSRSEFEDFLNSWQWRSS